MTRIRSEFDPDLARPLKPLHYSTAEQPFPIPCSICGRDFFFDEKTKDEINRRWELSGENPYVCLDCDAAFNDADYKRGS
jgi:DNA-directed RNA polymerase subunit RPC12/RpoP